MQACDTRKTLTQPAVAYCDGAYNPIARFGGWGFRVEHKGVKTSDSGSSEGDACTDLEVIAAIKLLENTPPEIPLVVYCDCMAVVQTATRFQQGKPLRFDKVRHALRVLYQRLVELLQDRTVKFKWVAGHSGVKGNVEVDHLAKAGMRKAIRLWEAALDAAHLSRVEDTEPMYRSSIVGA